MRPPGARPALGLIIMVWAASAAAYDEPWLAHVALTAGHDDNLARASVSADERASGFGELDLGLNRLFAGESRTAVELAGSLYSVQYPRYSRWSHNGARVLARVNHRPHGGFYMPTLSAWSAAEYRDHRSELRDGARYTAGVSLRQPLTTRVSLRAGLHRQWVRAEHAVFRTQTTTLELDLDWRLSERFTTWLGASTSSGDFASTSSGQAGLRAHADRWTSDDAFPDADTQQVAYRLDGRSRSLALGAEYELQANLLAGLHMEYTRTRTDYARPYRRRLVVATLRWTHGWGR